jgi:hypothetical protein
MFPFALLDAYQTQTARPLIRVGRVRVEAEFNLDSSVAAAQTASVKADGVDGIEGWGATH